MGILAVMLLKRYQSRYRPKHHFCDDSPGCSVNSGRTETPERQPGGEQRIDHILNKYGSASVLDNLGDLFSAKANQNNADPRLGGLLGDSGVQAANMLSNQFNLKTDTANQFITMLAPVIWALTKT
ncbi:MAG: DUF937 domain-containing protein [Calditrichia bacterium]